MAKEKLTLGKMDLLEDRKKCKRMELYRIKSRFLITIKNAVVLVLTVSVTKRYDAHLKFVHGLDPSSQEYKDKLAEGFPVKEIFLLEKIKEDRFAQEHDKIRRNCDKVGAIPDFREGSASKNIYIAPSKSDLLVIEQIKNKRRKSWQCKRR